MGGIFMNETTLFKVKTSTKIWQVYIGTNLLSQIHLTKGSFSKSVAVLDLVLKVQGFRRSGCVASPGTVAAIVAVDGTSLLTYHRSLYALTTLLECHQFSEI